MNTPEVTIPKDKELSPEGTFNLFKGNRRRRRFIKSKSHVLAVIKPGDEEHPLVKEFLSSLPPGTNKILDSFGYIGSLGGHLSVLRYESSRAREDERHFVLYHTSDIEKLNTDYFKLTENASVRIIPDCLTFHQIHYGWDDLRQNRHVFVTEFEGSVKETLSLYKERSSRSARRLLGDTFSQSDQALEKLTRKTWFGLSKERKFPTTHIFMGIETPELDYLITTSYKGPVEGSVKGRNIRYK